MCREFCFLQKRIKEIHYFQYVETLITGPGMILVFNLLRVWREKAIDYQECPYRSPRGAFKGGGGTTTLETFKLSEN